jgi:hypothetical protein
LSTTVASAAPARFGPWRNEVFAFLELLAVTGIALTQPALDILRRNPAIFITQGTSGLELVVLTVGLVLVAPLGLWVVEVLVGLVAPPARRIAHLVLLGLVAAAIGIQVLKKQTDLGEIWLVAGGIVAGVALALLVARFALMRTWLRFLAVAPVIFAVLFLLSSSVRTVVFDPSPAAAEGVHIGNPKRVVMLVMDEFPIESLLDGNGRIDATLFPNFAALAADSTWYRNHTTVAPYTEEAVPAIVTGDLPEEPGVVPVASSYPENLFTLLGGEYSMNVHERITRLCPESLCPESERDRARTAGGLRRLARETLDLWADDASPERQPVDINLGKIADPNLRAFGTGRDFVRSLVPSTKPRLDYLHVLLPHQAWHYVGTGQDYLQTGVAPGLPFYIWEGEWAAMSGRQRHLLQLQAADTLLGEIVAKLRAIGAYDDSLVVLTADHGVAFRPDDSFRGVSADNYPEIMWTPLFVKAPGQQQGEVDDRPLRTVDVLPTIADHLDAEIPWEVDGRSALGRPQPDGPREVFEWYLNVLKPPEGEQYITVDGPKGFAAAMAGRASDQTGDPRLRLYRLGRYGDLIGRRTSELAVGAPGPAATVVDPAAYRRVVRTARRAPWLYVQGTVATPEAGRSMVIAVNGVVAGTAETSVDPGFGDHTAFWGMLAPGAFRDGPNDLSLFLVDGPPDAPKLTPLPARDIGT